MGNEVQCEAQVLGGNIMNIYVTYGDDAMETFHIAGESAKILVTVDSLNDFG